MGWNHQPDMVEEFTQIWGGGTFFFENLSAKMMEDKQKSPEKKNEGLENKHEEGTLEKWDSLVETTSNFRF